MLLSACYYASSHSVPLRKPFTLGRKTGCARCPSNLLTATSDSDYGATKSVSLSASPRKLRGTAGALACDDSCGLLPMRTKLVWHSRSQLCSDPASSPRFPIYLRPTSLAWGSLDTLPLPCSPFLKDLHDSSPCLPICSHCKQRRLPHSSPLRPHFPCQKAQTQRFPVANTANVRHSPRS
jgi:hypothetical protein